MGRSVIANYLALYEMDPTSLPRKAQTHGRNNNINDPSAQDEFNQLKNNVEQQVESDT